MQALARSIHSHALALKALVVVLVALLPLVSRVLGTPVGAFSMFERLQRYRLVLTVRTPSGEHRVLLRTLTPHLSHAAQRIVLPAESNALGADQVALVAGGLDDLAALVCKLRPEATSVRAELTRSPLRSNARTETLERACSPRR